MALVIMSEDKVLVAPVTRLMLYVLLILDLMLLLMIALLLRGGVGWYCYSMVYMMITVISNASKCSK